jgi:hypothetical protein
MRGWVCNLHILLVLASAISRPYFTVSDLRLPFSSPPTTGRVTVEVFDPTSTWGFSWIESESESYVTTDGQSASLSWYKAPIRGLRPDFYFRTESGIRLTVTFLNPWGALFDERTGLSFVYAAGHCQRSFYRVIVTWDLRPYFAVSDLRLPFSSPPTTRRVTVEVFDPASTRVSSSLYSLEFTNELSFITSRGPNRGHHTEAVFVIFPLLRECFCLYSLQREHFLASRSLAYGLALLFVAIPAFGRCLPSRCLANGHIRHYITVRLKWQRKNESPRWRILEKLIVAQLVSKCSIFNASRKIVTFFTNALHCHTQAPYRTSSRARGFVVRRSKQGIENVSLR